jgi:hypothetical protein
MIFAPALDSDSESLSDNDQTVESSLTLQCF